MKRVSFTELGVTLVAILMLGSVAYPLLAQGKVRGARSTCLSNMKQIGASVMLYAADYDEVLPVTTELRPKLGFGAHWSALIQPYIRSERIFVCPGDPAPAYTYQDSGSRLKAARLLSYVNNYAAIPAHDFYPVPRSALTAPANLILIGERRSEAPNGTKMRGWKGTSAFVPGQPCAALDLGEGYRRVSAFEAVARLPKVRSDKELLILRANWSAHGDGSNYIFADGHARTMSLAETLDPTDFKWGERFYPRAKPDAACDGRNAEGRVHPKRLQP